jgi:hypothetical protein
MAIRQPDIGLHTSLRYSVSASKTKRTTMGVAFTFADKHSCLVGDFVLRFSLGDPKELK